MQEDVEFLRDDTAKQQHVLETRITENQTAIETQLNEIKEDFLIDTGGITAVLIVCVLGTIALTTRASNDARASASARCSRTSCRPPTFNTALSRSQINALLGGMVRSWTGPTTTETLSCKTRR